jgi:1-acyl-sn-glycerol-3-phosphate acyltransferase
MSSQFSLLASRRFGPFFGTQFLGAFNDNLFKNALVVLLTFQTAQWTSLAPELLANLAAGIFILPFFLFSATAGQLADKYDKSRLARLVKLLEIAIMSIAGFGFWLHSLALLLSSLFLLGLHSTLFGPVKYAILPQHLRDEELVGGNALIEAGTFVAILVGTLVGGFLAGYDDGVAWITGTGLAVSVAGYAVSRGIPAAPAPEPFLAINPNPFTETWRNIRFTRENRTVFLSILGISWFWLFGALMLAQFPAYAKNVLGGTESSVTLLLGAFTLGIGLGSLLCERLSARLVEIGLVPFGSIGLTLFGLDIAFASPALAASQPLPVLALLALPATLRVLFDLFAMGLFGGFFIVPLYALVQIRSSASHRARIIATNNIVNALFMVVGAGAAAGLLSLGLSIPALFGTAALCNAAVAIYIYRLVPEFLIRFIVWLLVHSLYRLEKRGMDSIPDEGPAVLVCNHASYVDSLVITAACRRPIRFVLDRRFFDMPVLSYLLRRGRAIPFSAEEGNPVSGERVLAEISAALAAGQLVAVFPEGDISTDGEMRAFMPWIDRVFAKNQAPVVPLALTGLWGSVFSRRDGALSRRLTKLRLFQKIAIAAGAPLEAASADSAVLTQAVRSLKEQSVWQLPGHDASQCGPA